MASKTITIDMEAYQRLTRVRRENESFSKVIKRVVRAPFDVDAYLRRLDVLPISAEAAEAIESHESRRHGRPDCRNGFGSG